DDRRGAGGHALPAVAQGPTVAEAGAGPVIDLIRTRPILTAILGLFLLGSFPIVPETKQAVVVRFGKPVRIYNQYKPGRPIGAQGAGINWRLPFAEDIVWIDKRVLDVDMQRQQVL